MVTYSLGFAPFVAIMKITNENNQNHDATCGMAHEQKGRFGAVVCAARACNSVDFRLAKVLRDNEKQEPTFGLGSQFPD